MARSEGPSLADLIGEIPEEIVAAIAFAAVEAYKAEEKRLRSEYNRAYAKTRKAWEQRRIAELKGGETVIVR